MLMIASLVSRSMAAQDWEKRFVPEPDCVPTVALGSLRDNPGDALQRGTLTVRVQRFGTHQSVGGLAIGFAPADSQATAGRPRYDTDTSSTRRFVNKTPGKYSLGVRSIGFARASTTAMVRPGGDDTITVYLQLFQDSYDNAHNCRPHGFRRTGEKACVSDSTTTSRALDYARRLTADTTWFKDLRKFKLAGVRLRLATSESVCERAGRKYGGASDPPRKVIVVEMGPLYLIYDPFEPLHLGEWEGWMIVDRDWRVIMVLAS